MCCWQNFSGHFCSGDLFRILPFIMWQHGFFFQVFLESLLFVMERKGWGVTPDYGRTNIMSSRSPAMATLGKHARFDQVAAGSNVCTLTLKLPSTVALTLKQEQFNYCINFHRLWCLHSSSTIYSSRTVSKWPRVTSKWSKPAVCSCRLARELIETPDPSSCTRPLPNGWLQIQSKFRKLGRTTMEMETIGLCNRGPGEPLWTWEVTRPHRHGHIS